MQSFLTSGKLSISDDKNSVSTSKTFKKGKIIPWIEKYRPKTVQDIVEQNEVISVLEQCIFGADLPNLLFYGPPGTGKTSTILAASKQLFGDIYQDRILELNASDERGIQVIRDKVKAFSQLTASGTRPDGKPCPPFKIVILDEADSMTHAAQAALRRTMEKETKTTRFCLICNYVSRIIEPLASRCSKFRFKPLKKEKLLERLNFICKEENLSCHNDCLELIVQESDGDMRRAITCLQSCSKFCGINSEIDIKTVIEVTGVIPLKWINDFFEVCSRTNYVEVVEFVKRFIYEAHSAYQFLDQMNDFLVSTDILDDQKKAVIGDKLGNATYSIQNGGSEYIQLCSLGAVLISVYST